ncbi:Fc receptor-like protein 2 [Poecilia reticulata]|uniref:Fc receptor-like protein 2 n=1 Tax=Poecilia reticulata TaxID=8081 RepID=UPI0004A45F1F|nr:PREDICTED: Fc receptor-like protein 2 [Poecilia reticulata]
MKVPSVCLLLGVSAVLLAGGTDSEVSLIVRPDLQQFFSGQSVSLSCEDGQTADGWTVKRTKGTLTETCGASGSDFGVFKDSFCVLDLLSSYTGVYWCETSAGQRSDHINITVNQKEDRVFILEIPALPVVKGINVTLHCRHKDGSIRAAFFYRNSQIIGDGVKSQKAIIHRVQQSDEGSYWCSTDTSGSSPHSYLRVRDPPLPQPSSYPMTASTSSADGANHTASSPSPSVSLVHLLCHLLVICPYCVCSILLASICCSRSSGNQAAVSIETTQLGGPGDIAADVTTEHEF